MVSDPYKQLICKANFSHPNHEIVAKVARKIEQNRRRKAEWGIAAYTLCTLAGLFLLWPALKTIVSMADETGFSQYFETALTGGSSLLFAWKDLAISMLESLPVAGILAFLLLVLIIIYGLRHALILANNLNLLRKNGLRSSRNRF